MSAEREAMELALPLLKSAHVSTNLVWQRHDAVQAMELALAQGITQDVTQIPQPHSSKPPQRQPLTPGAIRNLYARHCDPVEFARAVEAAYEASAKR